MFSESAVVGQERTADEDIISGGGACDRDVGPGDVFPAGLMHLPLAPLGLLKSSDGTSANPFI